MALARDALWAAEVEVDGVAVWRGEGSGSEEGGRVVGAKLDKEGAVDGGIAVEVGRIG